MLGSIGKTPKLGDLKRRTAAPTAPVMDSATRDAALRGSAGWLEGDCVPQGADGTHALKKSRGTPPSPPRARTFRLGVEIQEVVEPARFAVAEVPNAAGFLLLFPDVIEGSLEVVLKGEFGRILSPERFRQYLPLPDVI
jgi:hypothetical protein